MAEPLHTLGVVEIGDGVRAGRLRAADVLEHHLARIARLNPALNALVHLDAAGARRAAADIDARVARGDDPGALAGVPFGVKELEDVAGWPWTHGSRLFADHVASTTSTQVTRLRAAGGVPVGLTASPEIGSASFTASLLHGVTRNPWKPTQTPGGSSGGSAAAVAAGLLPFATGSDSGGSLRIPASFCGLVGFKGTYGRIPRGPTYVGMPHVRNYGALTRSIRDTARFLDCVVGPDEHDPLSLPHPGFSYEARLDEVGHVDGARVAWSTDLGFAACEPEVAAVARDAADRLIRAAALEERAVPVVLPDPGDAWQALLSPDLYARFAPYLPARIADVHPIVAFMFEGASRIGVRDVAQAAALRDTLVQALAVLFEQVDLLLLPTTATPAFAAEGPMPTTIAGRTMPPLRSVAQTYVFNLSGHPAISVPAGTVDGVPVGLQIVARRHEDLLVLAAAAALERVRPWPRLAPVD